MKIFHFVNTKVPPEESPLREVDFHTLFYPQELVSHEDLRKMERKIRFFPHIEKKEVYFFQELKGEQFLVILNIRSLPEERDTFGRGGIYLCHGFLFPPQLWKEFAVPRDLLTLVSKHLFQNLSDLRASSLVDRQSGNSLPIEILNEHYRHLLKEDPPTLLPEEQQVVVMLVEKAAINNPWPIIIQGSPEHVSNLMNKVSVVLPNELKRQISWDPGYEGSISDHPLKIFGFSGPPPNISQAVFIELSERGGVTAISSTPDCPELFEVNHPYGRWLKQRFQSAYPPKKEEIERAYLLLIDGLKASDKMVLLLTGFPLGKVAERLEPDELIFQRLYNNKETHQKIIDLFREIFSGKEFKGIEELLFRQMDGGKAYLLLTGKMDMMMLLEKMLQQGEWDEDEMKELCIWAKKEYKQSENYPFITSFLYPQEKAFANEILENQALRKRLLKTLILHHNYSHTHLEQAGFQEQEWQGLEESLKANQGIKGKLRRFLG